MTPGGRFSSRIPRNLWAVSVTSFLMDVSSEMVLNILPLFLANVLGARAAAIGLIEGVAEATASLLKVFSGALSDRLGSRKWLAVGGYGLSAAVKPGFLFVTSWLGVAAVRWGDRAGKGIRTAPRDALLADSLSASTRGVGFGLHRAADTLGAVAGLLIAVLIVRGSQAGALTLDAETFRRVVLVSLVPGFLAVGALAWGAREVRKPATAPRVPFGLRGLGRPFLGFLLISALFDLGNFSDAFLVLRAQERGLSVTGVLWTLLAFNLVYALVATPAGRLSDRVGRKRLLVSGWMLYAAVFAGFALATSALHVVVLYLFHGVYYGLTAGSARALIADLVPAERRGTAYGTYHAVLGLIDIPASVIAGVLWQGIGGWDGFGPAAPYWFGAAAALAAALWLTAYRSGGALPGARNRPMGGRS